MAEEAKVYTGRVAHVLWAKECGFIEPDDQELKRFLDGKQVYFHLSKCYVILDGHEHLVRMPIQNTLVVFTMDEGNRSSKVALFKTEAHKLVNMSGVSSSEPVVRTFKSFVPAKSGEKGILVEVQDENSGTKTLVEVPTEVKGHKLGSYAMKSRARRLAAAQQFQQ